VEALGAEAAAELDALGGQLLMMMGTSSHEE
jgi:hypothetical protein